MRPAVRQTAFADLVDRIARIATRGVGERDGPHELPMRRPGAVGHGVRRATVPRIVRRRRGRTGGLR